MPKLDRRWRNGFVLGKSANSSQILIATFDGGGGVVRTKAIIRAVPAIRCDATNLFRISIPPTTFDNRNQDENATSESRHAREHDVRAEDAEALSLKRRIRVYDKDVLNVGRTTGSPRRTLVRTNQIRLAKPHKHDQTCRTHIYQQLKAANYHRIRAAELERLRNRPSISKDSNSPTPPIHDDDAADLFLGDGEEEEEDNDAPEAPEHALDAPY